MAGVIGAAYTTPAITSWYKELAKPSWNPPNWIFGPVWTTLFVLMGISLYLVWSKNFKVINKVFPKIKKVPNKISEKFWSGKWMKANIILIFSLQLLLNILWSVIFFAQQNPALAFFELIMLWFAIIFTMVNFYRVSKLSAWLLLPYLLWVSFAGFLNLTIWMLN